VSGPNQCQDCRSLRLEVEGLRRALESRDVIGQAKGLIMAGTACGPDEAFETLVSQSQYENRRVSDVAEGVVQDHLARLIRVTQPGAG
jgi:AmiR/NasT family two-component response regulator